MMATEETAARLDEMARGIRVCTACPLSQGRTNAVPGEGPAHADVMFIGEGPGFYEDKQGRPFVGQAGKFLEELLASVGWKREQVYITNTVKCRPPNNRDPLPNELDTCQEHWLDAQIATIQPKVIVTLGRYSLARIFPHETIGKARGRPMEKDGITIYPIYHPAAALHQQRLRTVIMEDFRRLPQVVADVKARSQEASQAPPDQPATTAPPEAQRPEDPQQLSFF